MALENKVTKKRKSAVQTNKVKVLQKRVPGGGENPLKAEKKSAGGKL